MKKSLILAAAMAGLIAGANAHAEEKAAEATTKKEEANKCGEACKDPKTAKSCAKHHPKNKCGGANGCGSKNGCGAKMDKNSCKGHGATDSKEAPKAEEKK